MRASFSDISHIFLFCFLLNILAHFLLSFIRYGEGWNFGEVANNGRGVNASQFNLTGTGIGRCEVNCLNKFERKIFSTLSSMIVQHLPDSVCFTWKFMSLFSFNDRIRDATLGGSPFGHPLQQGFITGLLLQVFSILFVQLAIKI